MCSWLSRHQLTLFLQHRHGESDSSWSWLVSSDWLFLLHWAVVGLSPCPSVVVFLLPALRTTLPQGHAPKHPMMVVSRNLNELHFILFTSTFFLLHEESVSDYYDFTYFLCPFFLERNVVSLASLKLYLSVINLCGTEADMTWRPYIVDMI